MYNENQTIEQVTYNVVDLLKEVYGINEDKIYYTTTDNNNMGYIVIDDVTYYVYPYNDPDELASFINANIVADKNTEAFYNYFENEESVNSMDNEESANNVENEESVTNTANVGVSTTEISENRIADSEDATISKGDVCHFTYDKELRIEQDDEDKDLEYLTKDEPYCEVKGFSKNAKGMDTVTVSFYDVFGNDNLDDMGQMRLKQLNDIYYTVDAYPSELFVSFKSRVKENVDTTKITTDLSNDYPALLVALDSEKDAEITYKTLIDIEKNSDSPNKEVIELLEKILTDELEHIALLSALQAKNNSEYVADDAQEVFTDYVEDIKTEDN